MLQSMYPIWPEKQRKKVAMWVKQRVLENSFNCTTPTSGSTLGRKLGKFPKKLCEASNPCQDNIQTKFKAVKSHFYINKSGLMKVFTSLCSEGTRL